jgi:hypothetical protein
MITEPPMLISAWPTVPFGPGMRIRSLPPKACW